MSTAGSSWFNNPAAYLQGAVGAPVTITSGLRSPQHNAAVGGVPNSDHLTGNAYDFVPQGMPMQTAYNNLQQSGVPVKQVLNEGDHIHVAFDPSTGAPSDPLDAALASQAGAPQQPAAAQPQTDPLDAALAQQASTKSAPVNTANLPKLPPAQTSQSLGFEQGVGNFLANAASPLISAGTAMGLPMQTFQQGADLMRNPNHAPGVVPGKIGRAASDILETAPLYATGGALFGGGLSGALGASQQNKSGQNVAPSATNVATSAGIGAAAGKGMDMVLGGLKAAIAPAVKPAIQTLLNAKIPLTMGQTVGGGLQSFEDKLTSIPVLGGMIQGAKDRSVIGLNKAVYNRVLQPVGETMPAAIPVGRESVDHIATTLGDKYDSLLPTMNANISEPQFGQDVTAVLADAKTKLPPPQFDRLQGIVQNQFGKADPTGAVDGDTLKGIHSELTRLSSGLGSDPSFDNRELAGSIGDLQGAFRGMVTRQNPAQAPQLQAIDTAYANFVRLRKAASAVGAKDGVFSAPQLANAVRASDKSVGKGAYARGTALMQDLSDPAKAVLPSTVPDSGTAGRGLMGALLLDGAAHVNPMMAVPGLAASALYTAPGQAMARGLLGSARPAWAPAAAGMIGRARLPLGLSSAALLPPLIGPQN